MEREGVCDLQEHSRKYRSVKSDCDETKCVLKHSKSCCRVHFVGHGETEKVFIVCEGHMLLA